MIGIDISDRSIKIVHLSKARQPQLLSRCWLPVPLGAIERGIVTRPEVVQKTIREAFASCNISLKVADAVVMSIPETQSFLRVIEIPIMREDEIGEAIRWEVAQHIPFGVENVYIDWQPLIGGHRAGPGRQEILVGAAQKKVVNALYGAVVPVGLDIAAFELESQAIARALISDELRARQGLLVVDLGDTATNVIIHDHQAMRFTASIQKGVEHLLRALPGTSRLADQAFWKEAEVRSEELASALQPTEEELVVEIRSIVEFYNSIDAQHEVKEILLTGGGSNLPGLDRAFLRYFDSVHVQRGNPWVNLMGPGGHGKAPLDLPESVRLTTAVGLALRKVVQR